jgi:hypothetical protein
VSSAAVTDRSRCQAGGEEALRYLFDYNTVESTLLFSAILVCLFGVMFASDFFQPGSIFYKTLGTPQPTLAGGAP